MAENADRKEQSDQDQTFKKKMRRLLFDVRFETGIPEDVARAIELSSMVQKLQADGAMEHWPTEMYYEQAIVYGEEMGTKQVPKQIYLVTINQSGDLVRAPELLELPKRPATFIDAFEDFIKQKPWDEVKRRLAEPRVDKSVEEFNRQIDNIKSELQPAFEMRKKIIDTNSIYSLIIELSSTRGLSWPDNSYAGRSMYLVRKGSDGSPEYSPEPIRLPKRPAGFINALEAYVAGKKWHEVKELLPSSTGASGPDRAKIEELQNQASEVQSFNDAGEVAEKIHAQLSNTKSQIEAMRVLHRRVEQILENRTHDLTTFAQLKPLTAELASFSKSENAGYFMTLMFFDFIDAAALRIGKQMIASTRSEDELKKALEAIHGYDFRYAEAYTAPFTESREDALAKLEFLDKLRGKRSEQGLNDLRKEVETFQFKSTDMAQQYRDQIYNFIERKREVYWPSKLRPSMPKP